MTADEYLAWEREQPEKHEFHDGEVFAMAGGSARHNLLSNAFGAELRAALRGKGCHVLSSDQRVVALSGRRFLYPDVVATCGELRFEAGTTDVLANPTVIVEVLSPSTEAYDRGGKWEAYQRIPSLTDYVLVAQGTASLEHFAREADGAWRYRLLGLGEVLTLSNGATLAVDAVFDGAFEVAAG
jgi:Uma2 family endonuclease